MRALIVSDIHSNLEAFQSVLQDAETHGGFDEVWSLGDLVGYGPDPGPCIELLQSCRYQAVIGNHDLASVGKLGLEEFNPYAAAANRWTSTQLSHEHRDFLSDLPLRLVIDNFTLVHGSPRDPVWEYVMSREVAAENFGFFDTMWCLVGHSHIPFLCAPTDNTAMFVEFPLDKAVKLRGQRLIMNPGGVGQPRDSDPRASYAIYDSQLDNAYHFRVAYDIPTTQEKMRRRGLPRFLIERLEFGH